VCVYDRPQENNVCMLAVCIIGHKKTISILLTLCVCMLVRVHVCVYMRVYVVVYAGLCCGICGSMLCR